MCRRLSCVVRPQPPTRGGRSRPRGGVVAPVLLWLFVVCYGAQPPAPWRRASSMPPCLGAGRGASCRVLSAPPEPPPFKGAPAEHSVVVCGVGRERRARPLKQTVFPKCVVPAVGHVGRPTQAARTARRQSCAFQRRRPRCCSGAPFLGAGQAPL
ncbi:MAG: hypothetical protein J3K34DRAFT_398410 [Monoraphidium minutum]|nr:MAG: hypothetical protein J3K34DRAFT_398410 [Monoraphidium minutum]